MSHHPSAFILDQFASGDIEDQLAVMVSSHAESCEVCAKYIFNKESEMTSFFLNPSCMNKFEPRDMADQIMQNEVLLRENSLPQQPKPEDDKIILESKKVELPRKLLPLKKYMSPWKKKIGGICISKVDLAGSGNMYFLYFNKGTEIPMHSHGGNEFVYVVSGSFTDGVSEYITGDFACFTPKDTHTPTTEDPDGCLLLVSIEAPFKFTKGWARILNPFRRFIFD